MIFKDSLFKRLLVLLFFIFFSLVLLYTDYLLETTLFSNKFELGDLKVSLNTYHMFKNSSLLTQKALKSSKFAHLFTDLNDIDPGFSGGNFIKPVPTTHSDDDHYDQNSGGSNSEVKLTNEISDDVELELDKSRLYLLPPLPYLDLVYTGPVFMENGLVRLTCNTIFFGVECKIKGTIKSGKTYLANTHIDNTVSERITLKVSFKSLLNVLKNPTKAKTDQEDKKLVDYSIAMEQNANGIRLLTNYLFLMGNHGKDIELFENDHKSLETVQQSFERYDQIQQYVVFLFELFHLKVFNFALLSLSFLSLFVWHIIICSLLRVYFEVTPKSQVEDPEISPEDRVMEYLLKVNDQTNGTSFQPYENSSTPSNRDSFTSISKNDIQLLELLSPLISPETGSRPTSSIKQIIENMDSPVGPYNDDMLVEKSKISYGLFVAHFLMHYLIYFIVSLLIYQLIDSCSKKMFENITIGATKMAMARGGESPMEINQAGGGDIHSNGLNSAENSGNSIGGETLNMLLDACGIVLNALIFGFLHFIYGVFSFLCGTSV